MRVPVLLGALAAIAGCATAGSEPDASGGDFVDARQFEIDAAIPDAPPPDAAPRLPCVEGNINAEDPGTGRCYMVFTTRRTWATAAADCEALAGDAHLVTILDAGEAAFVTNLLTERSWIGLNDIDVENTFVWVTGDPLDFELWAQDEPNNSGNEDCVEIATTAGEWNDEGCGETRHYVCERS
jgi:hypothetical protein